MTNCVVWDDIVMGIQYYIRSNVIMWLPCASQLIQEIMLEEKEGTKAFRAEASADVTLGDDLSDISSVPFTS